MNSEGVWRWNVDDIWQSYSSMYQESFLAGEMINDIMRYHHLTSCLLFGGCAIESFMNKNMRAFLENKDISEEKIFKKIRYTNLRKKMEKWPSDICNMMVEEKDIETISRFLDLRNEVTHRKRKDHSLYKELDEANPLKFIEAIQSAFIVIYSGLDNSFPYWLLGWNFVGMNGDETHPSLINNQQFKHALVNMGFQVPAFDYNAANAWEKET